MVAAVRTMLLGLLVAAALVLGVASAGAATNLVPNPRFTDDCSGVPCHWTAGAASSAISRDTATFRSTPASISLSRSSLTSIEVAQSDCIPISPSTGYFLSGWYWTTASVPIGLRVSLYSDGACSVVVSGFGVSPLPVTGAWTLLQAQGGTPSNAHSALVELQMVCGFFFCPFTPVNFDDIGLGTTPTAVSVDSFTARRAGKGVLVRWRTGTEANELGFNVYRQEGARRVRVNRRLLPALGGIGGSPYSYRDRRAPGHRALRYWLQDVAVDGTRTWHGPVRVSGA